MKNAELAKLKIARSRKKRAWVTDSNQLKDLGRGAQRLARKFASKQNQAGVAKCLHRLGRLLQVEQACKLAQGDLLVELIDRYDCRPIDISRALAWPHGKVSQRYHTSKTYPPAKRKLKLPYNHYFLATSMLRKFKQLSMKPAAALQEVQTTGYTQHRDVTRHFAQLDQRHRLRSLAITNSRTPIRPSALALHHCPFQDVLGLVPDGSAKIIHCDPPYVYPDGTYRSSSSRSQACDNSSRESAIATVLDLLRDWQPKLAPGGVLLLWQAACLPPAKIVSAIEEFGWAHAGPIIWDKGRPQPGCFSSPYTRQTEHLLVLYRAGERIISHDNASRSDILSFTPVSNPALIAKQEHSFEKPISLCEFLVRRHSDPGELAIDLCGCTGSMSVAAIQAGRQWMYVESNAKNFRLGSARIRGAVAEIESTRIAS